MRENVSNADSNVVDFARKIVDRTAYNGYDLVAADVLESTKSSLMKSRLVEFKFRRRPCLRRVCCGLVLLGFAAFVALTGFKPDNHIAPSNRSLLSLPNSVIPSYWQRETTPTKRISTLHIEDVLRFDSDILLLIRVPAGLEFPPKDSIECRYGGPTRFAYSKALAVNSLPNNRAAILCGAPPVDIAWDVSSVLIVVDQEHEIRKGEASPDYRQPLPWTSCYKVAYEAFATNHDVVVFVHGVSSLRGLHHSAKADQERLKSFRCVYGGYFETPVTAQSQEIFRCGHPPQHLVSVFAGQKMTLKFEAKILPSVAYYNPLEIQPRHPEQLLPPPKLHHICVCTMIYNGAKFLKEWVHYHSHLGVEKFFLYDNNSEDNLEDVIASLALAGFNVTKQAWPWVKTQEAGFSHGALLASPECTWMLYIDVDEYFFPNKRFLSTRINPESAEVPSTDLNSTSSSILATFIREAVKAYPMVGQISTFCHNYGPSGLTASPPKGVTQGYTCRMRTPERHKSILLLDSFAENLATVVHHFGLKGGYEWKLMSPSMAVINHYKFQAWDEFKVKFRRRAATYVADWRENRNRGSNDRVPDLGTKAVKPADWEGRYCQVQDYRLRNYTRSVFGSYDNDSQLHLAWES